MNPVRSLLYLALFVLASQYVSPSFADPEASTDPSGTWVWESAVNGDYDKNMLVLQSDGSTLSGAYTRGEINAAIQNGNFSSDGFDFEIPIATNNGELIVIVEGKANGDSISGVYRYAGDSNEETFTWEGKRAIQFEDVRGTWAIEITSDQGQTFSDQVTFSQIEQSLAGSYKSASAERVVPLENPRFDSDFSVAFTIVIDDLTVDFTGEPDGDSINGDLTYVYQGNSGTGRFHGNRESSDENAALGQWDISFVADDDNTYTPSIIVERNADTLAGTYIVGATGNQLPLTTLEFTDDTFTFKTGADWGNITYVGQIEGDRIAGTVSYDYNGYQGSNPFTGVRAK